MAKTTPHPKACTKHKTLHVLEPPLSFSQIHIFTLSHFHSKAAKELQNHPTPPSKSKFPSKDKMLPHSINNNPNKQQSNLLPHASTDQTPFSISTYPPINKIFSSKSSLPIPHYGKNHSPPQSLHKA